MDLAERAHSPALLADGIPEEPGCGSELQVPPRRLAGRLTSGPGSVGLVDEDRHRVVASQSFGKPNMVAVTVVEHDAADIAQRAVHGRKLGGKIPPVTREPGVDDGHSL